MSRSDALAAATLSVADVARLQRLADVSDVDLGVRLLRGTPTNQSRSDGTLRSVSERAQAFGCELASSWSETAHALLGEVDGVIASPPRSSAEGRGMTVVERRDGLTSSDPAVARFSHRTRTVELYLDTVEHCESLVDRLDWRASFPLGSVRAAAIEHERAHDLIGHAHARDLRVAVGLPAMSLGRWRRWAHVAGADELASHAFAQAVLGLGRSPLLVTAAAASALDTVRRTAKES